MASVFMSFIHEEEYDVVQIRLFIQEVLQYRVETFMSSDQSVIYAGEDWMARIFDELKSATVLLSMLSPRSITRPWINFEAGAAWMNEKKVIPVCFRNLTIGQLPKPYSSLQAVDISMYDGAYYLVNSIAHYLELPDPEKPIFHEYLSRPTLDYLDYTEAEIEKNRKLFAPYKRLKQFLEISDLIYAPKEN